MQHFVDENVVMRFYLERMDADKIEFLKGKDGVKAQIREKIGQLLATRKMNDRIAVATGLWKVLFEAAMSSIDRDKQGYDKLFSYFDEYVDFEELIFASDSFYRDHTLHCMWVYFLGEYIAHKGDFDVLFETGETQYRLIEAVREVVSGLGTQEEEQVQKLLECCRGFEFHRRRQDAMRCVAALTHDLGYPLKKIEKINRSIRKILPYYAVESFGEFKFEYGNVGQLFIEAFLKQISTRVNVEIEVQDKQAAALMASLFREQKIDGRSGNLVGVDRDFLAQMSDEDKQFLARELKVKLAAQRTFFQEARADSDFASYQHGMMSAFLLAKNVRAFQNMRVELRPELQAGVRAWSDYQCKNTILNAITLHTCDSYRIAAIDDHSFLTFIDELEEFSRISRASQSREYVEEFCSSRIFMEDGWFTVEFTFDNNDLENLDPERAFKGRCKRFLTLFQIPDLDEKLKIRLRCIGRLEKNQSLYQLELARNHAKIFVDGREQNIPAYLRSSQFYTSEEYAEM